MSKIINGIGLVSFVMGTFAIPGAIEFNESLIKPIAMMLIGGTIVLIGANKGEKKINDFTSSDDYRLYFLH